MPEEKIVAKVYVGEWFNRVNPFGTDCVMEHVYSDGRVVEFKRTRMIYDVPEDVCRAAVDGLCRKTHTLAIKTAIIEDPDIMHTTIWLKEIIESVAKIVIVKIDGDHFPVFTFRRSLLGDVNGVVKIGDIVMTHHVTLTVDVDGDE